MQKQLIIYNEGKPLQMSIRNYSEADFAGLIEIQRQSFPPPFPPELWWNEEQLHQHVARFPEGALCAEVNGQLIGSMTGLCINAGKYEGSHTWVEVTDNGYIRNHEPSGDTLYVVDIGVMPSYRKAGVGKWLMLSMYEVVVRLGLARLLGGGRMPGYHRYAQKVSPQVYLEKVIAGEWKDPVITFLLRCGRMPVGIADNYLEDDESCNFAALMEWRNPFRPIN